MTPHTHPSHHAFDLKVSMTALLLLAYFVAALAAAAGWGKAVSGMLGGADRFDGSTMGLEPPALRAQGLQP